MSRLWADQLRVGLAPQRVEMVRIRAGIWSRRIREERSLACAPESGQPPWLAALDTLDAMLVDAGTRAADVLVVLSNHFVRYVVMPWQPEVTGAREQAVAARHRFARIFGEGAQGWEIRYAETAYGKPGIACAIEAELLAGLGERLNRGALRLVAVQPLLMNAYNSLRRDLDPSGALAVIEPGRVCLSLFHESHWQHVVSRRTGGADPADVIEQELALAAPENSSAHLDILPIGTDARWTKQESRPARLRACAEDRQCPLALCGVAS